VESKSVRGLRVEPGHSAVLQRSTPSLRLAGTEDEDSLPDVAQALCCRPLESASQARHAPQPRILAKSGERRLRVSDQGPTLRQRKHDVFLLAVGPRSYLNVVATALLSYAGSLAAAEAPQPNQYETPGPVNAEDFLPKSAFSGKKIFVEKVAQNDGLQNTYRIRAGGGEYEITGSTAAMEVLQEIRAIHQLRQISTAKAFTQGIKESAKGTYQTGKEIVRDPGGALKKVPEGASKFFGKVKGFFSDDEEDAGQEAAPGETAKGILGVDKAKRKLAARLGVDVYSRNRVLQDELDRVASATAGGGVAFDIGTLPIGGALGIGLTVIGVQQAVDSLVDESSPISLRNWNEENLIKPGANQDLVFPIH
jgi:hypothetical protein